ncbi:tripartite motif-containing protein 66-like [Mytilus edulis]|uniref:tripartite motif-containing protein 66-like n=1 Tax=Mytilus edulis TaxID=6550 RepID=UPI0039F13C6F
MASIKRVPCGPCHERIANKKAEIWCYNCNEGLCSTCSSQHKISKSSRGHKTNDIKSYKPSIRAINTECDKHGQQLNLYCPGNLMPCCDECILTCHSNCTGIKSLASVVEETKMEKSKKPLEKNINSILDILNKIETNKIGNVKRGDQQCYSIRGRIAEFRNKINEHLDKLEKKLCQEAETVLNKEKSEG